MSVIKFYDNNLRLITFEVLIMKYKKILLFFSITLPLSILLRTLQLFFTVETTTGFFKTEYKTISFYLFAVIVAVCAGIAAVCFTGHRNPEHPPKINPILAVSSFLTAVCVIAELFDRSSDAVTKPWQTILLAVCGLLAAVYFLLYGMSGFVSIRLSPLLSLIPSVYFIVKIICYFTAISSLALISDNILVLSAYCVMLLFFLNFGKLYNGIDSERNFRKLMASGLVSVTLCLTQGLPHIFINLANADSYQHTSNAANLALLGFGLFIAVFTFSHFSVKNIEVIRRRKSSETTDGGFYFN